MTWLGIFLTPDSCFPCFFTPRKVVFSKICDTLKKSAKKFRWDRDSNLRPLKPWREKLPLGHGVNFWPLQISSFRFIRYQNSNGFGIFVKFYPRKKFAITFLDFSSAVLQELILIRDFYKKSYITNVKIFYKFMVSERAINTIKRKQNK